MLTYQWWLWMAYEQEESSFPCRVGLLCCMYFAQMLDSWRLLFFNSLPSAGRGHLEESWGYSLGKACANQILSPVDQHASEGYVICWGIGHVFQVVWKKISIATKDRGRRGGDYAFCQMPITSITLLWEKNWNIRN